MHINAKKCICIRVGRHFSKLCSSLVLSDGRTLPWSQELRYLGIFIRAGQHFRCDYSNCKQKFCRSVNSMFAKLGRYASEEVMISLVTTKGFPGLLYALEACPVLPSDLQSFDFCVYRFVMKRFHTCDGRRNQNTINNNLIHNINRRKEKTTTCMSLTTRLRKSVLLGVSTDRAWRHLSTERHITSQL